jgi:hypothetical protein
MTYLSHLYVFKLCLENAELLETCHEHFFRLHFAHLVRYAIVKLEVVSPIRSTMQSQITRDSPFSIEMLIDYVKYSGVGVVVLCCSSLRPNFGQGFAHKPSRRCVSVSTAEPSRTRTAPHFAHLHCCAYCTHQQSSAHKSISQDPSVHYVRPACYRILVCLLCRIRTAMCSLQHDSLKIASILSPI